MRQRVSILFEAKLDAFEKFLPIDQVEAQIDGIDEEELSQDERRSLAAFRRAIRMRREGKPAARLWGEYEDES